MSKWNDFLVEHAKFPFPHPDKGRSIQTTDISQIEAGSIRREWKANRAVTGDTPVQKFCHSLTLELDILGEALLPEDVESYLLADFLRRIQGNELGYRDRKWSTNSSEARISFPKDSRSSESFKVKQFTLTPCDRLVLVKSGSLPSGKQVFGTPELIILLMEAVVCEAKSPSVMKKVGELLPARGIELEWIPGRSLVRRILGKYLMMLEASGVLPPPGYLWR
ncbi:hypothetical protein F5887DRAFT_1074775 [Amanita rubescens]|nr:hypothetical protein F5887DRAFT_1084123 [Amanita rubescens]KAF8345130.1 hypothetical protein F5887DRAFT_1074775 [Amanita rubescens]